jgi:hypothetical protein
MAEAQSLARNISTQAVASAAGSNRVAAIDWMRGLVMVLMVIDRPWPSTEARAPQKLDQAPPDLIARRRPGYGMLWPYDRAIQNRYGVAY